VVPLRRRDRKTVSGPEPAIRFGLMRRFMGGLNPRPRIARRVWQAGPDYGNHAPRL